jgi:hypothetical protein
VPCVSKDIATYKLFYEEEVIMRAQQVELIYSQYRILYEILPDAPFSTFVLTKLKYGLRSNGIVGSTQRKVTYRLSNQMQHLSIQQTMANQNWSTTTPSTHTLEVHSVKVMNPKENHYLEEKIKSKGKKSKGDKKACNNVGEGQNKKRKVKFPCNLCMNDHLTHQ